MRHCVAGVLPAMLLVAFSTSLASVPSTQARLPTMSTISTSRPQAMLTAPKMKKERQRGTRRLNASQPQGGQKAAQQAPLPSETRGAVPSSKPITRVFARSQFPMRIPRNEVGDFGILTAEGWSPSRLADAGASYGDELRKRQPGWKQIKHAVVMIAGGAKAYLHFAISTCSNIRQNGYKGDIYVYLDIQNRSRDGCVISHLREMGVITKHFSELMPNFDHPLRGGRSPAWDKLGLVWNADMRKYDRIFFFDTDQFVNINVQDLIVRELPPNVAIAMCGSQCLLDSFNDKTACGWDCVKANKRFVNETKPIQQPTPQPTVLLKPFPQIDVQHTVSLSWPTLAFALVSASLLVSLVSRFKKYRKYVWVGLLLLTPVMTVWHHSAGITNRQLPAVQKLATSPPSPLPTRPRALQTCDNMGVTDVRRGVVDKEFFSHFPRKSFQYISGVWILDNTKLPSIEQTRVAAEHLFENLDPAWLSFGDQGFFANFFYDTAAILPECHISPKAWEHVFHTNVGTTIRGDGDKNNTVLQSFETRFKHFYKNATGLDEICEGPAFDDGPELSQNCSGLATYMTGQWIVGRRPCHRFEHVDHPGMWIFATRDAACDKHLSGADDSVRCDIKMVHLNENTDWIAARAFTTTQSFAVLNHQTVSHAWDMHQLKAPFGAYTVHCPIFPSVDSSVQRQTPDALATVAFVIITGEKYHGSRLKGALQSWVSWLPSHVREHNLYIVTDQLEGLQTTIDGYRTILVPDACCGDRYKSQLKWRDGLRQVGKELPAAVKWIVTVDDDTFLVVPNLMRFLIGKTPGRRIYGHQCPGGNLCGPAVLYPRPLYDDLVQLLDPVQCNFWPSTQNQEGLSDRILMSYYAILKAELADCKEFSSISPTTLWNERASLPQTGSWNRPPSGQIIQWHQLLEEEDFLILFKALYSTFTSATYDASGATRLAGWEPFVPVLGSNSKSEATISYLASIKDNPPETACIAYSPSCNMPEEVRNRCGSNRS